MSMWPFGRGHRDRTAPPLPFGSTCDRGLERARRADHLEVVGSHRVGYLRASTRAETTSQRQLPPLPILQIGVEPGGSIDFAHPVLGFPGIRCLPPRERVLELWADDLLTVSHGNTWTYVVQASDSFADEWLDLLVRPTDMPFRRWYAVVGAAFMGLASVGDFRMADLDATMHTTLVHVADRRRHSVPGARPARDPGPVVSAYPCGLEPRTF